VDEVEVDVEDRRLALFLVDDMGVPDFVQKGFRHKVLSYET